MNKKYILITFCIFTLIFVTLLSYKIILNTTQLTPLQQQSIDFNSMYQGPNMTYPGAQTPGMMEPMEPMAADSFSTFGTAF